MRAWVWLVGILLTREMEDEDSEGACGSCLSPRESGRSVEGVLVVFGFIGWEKRGREEVRCCWFRQRLL
ncbi:hypothetical protein HAX54_029152, partial [Datura stramonium]|nr:hypothetical protein [Datura stramonium]